MRAHRSARPERSIALRYRASLTVACILAAVMAAGIAYADAILTPTPEPLSTLIKFDDRDYQVAYSEAVSLEPTSTSIVRKIGYGKITSVNIATTPSGTYSSDGLTSPYIRYPGITVTAVRSAFEDATQWAPGQGFSIFSLGHGYNGGVTFNGLTERGVRSCMARGSFVSCYRTY